MRPTPNQPLRIAAVQLPCSDQREENLKQAIQAIRDAARNGAHLVCLQELFCSLYFCQTEDHRFFEWAEPIPGPVTEVLAETAREEQVVLVASLFERRAAGLYHNTAAVFERDGSLLGIYRKMHIPDDPYYYEKFYFTPGDLGFRVFETSAARVGVCICWDQWFPEAARLTALRGAEVLVYPTAIGWLAADKPMFGDAQRAAWQTMMRSHAIANGLFVVAPNRCGIEENIEFWGASFVCDPYGNLLAQAEAEPQTLLVDCDLQTIETARTHWPFLRDRRIDAYAPLAKRFLDPTDGTITPHG